jgi:iron complex outermembrane recepter protein
LSDGAPPGTVITANNETPRNQWKFQSFLNLSKTVQLDSLLFSASSILASRSPVVLIAPHTRFDVRLGWRVSPRFEVSVSGQDLFSPRHMELTPEVLSPPADAVRGYYLKTTWRF